MGSMHLAIGQAPIILGDVGKNLEIMENLICEAQKDHKRELDLIAFPELFVTGYNLRDNYKDVAEKIPGKGKHSPECTNWPRNTRYISRRGSWKNPESHCSILR